MKLYKNRNSIFLLFILILTLYIEPLCSQWGIQSNPPPTDINGNLYHSFTLSFNPRIIGKSFKTAVQYPDPIACASTSGMCTGYVYLTAPKYPYQVGVRRTVPQRVIQVKGKSLDVTSLQTPTINDVNTLTNEPPTSSTPSEFTLNSYTPEDYTSIGYRALNVMRRRLLVTHVTVQENDFIATVNTNAYSNCDLDNQGVCNAAVQQTFQYKGEDANNQALSNYQSRLTGEDSLEIKGMQLAANFTGNLITGIGDLTQYQTLVQNSAQNVKTALQATINSQWANINLMNATQAAESNALVLLQTTASALGYAIAQQQANLLEASYSDQQQAQVIQQALNFLQNQNALYTLRTANEVQLAQVISAMATDLQNNVELIVNDPSTLQTLTNTTFQGIKAGLAQGYIPFVTNLGVPPVVYNNNNKYESFMQGAYWYVLPTQIQLANGQFQSSWVIERMFYVIACDVTQFAVNVAQQTTFTAVAKWFGPAGMCDVDPVGSCLCRMQVSYQQTRNVAVANWVVNNIPSDNLLNPPTTNAPLIPAIYQNMSALYNGTAPSYYLYNITNNATNLYLPPYRQRWLYTLADVQNELQSVCLYNFTGVNQIPSTGLPNFANATLSAYSSNPAYFYIKSTIVGQTDAIIPVGSAIPTFNQTANPNETVLAYDFSVRPFCLASIDNTAELQLVQNTMASILYQGQMKAYLIKTPRLTSVLSYLRGALPTPTDIITQDFTYTKVGGVNDSLVRSDTAIVTMTSPNAIPQLKFYNRTRVINVTFVPDARSTHLKTQDLSSQVVWSDNVDSILPDFMTTYVYPHCFTNPCPTSVLNMNDTNIVLTSNTSASFLFTVPPRLKRESMDPAARYLGPNYIEKQQRVVGAGAVAQFFQTFNGFNTSCKAPTPQDWQQSSRGTFKPSLATTSLNLWLQQLTVQQYTVPSNADGGTIETYPLVFCGSNPRISTDMTECDYMNLAYPEFHIEDGLGMIYYYPYAYTVQTIPLRIPNNSTLTLPPPTSYCPDDILIDRKTLQKPSLEIFNTLVKSNSAFQVIATGCLPDNSDALHLYYPSLGIWNPVHVQISGCDGQTITVISNSTNPAITTPVTCFEYSSIPEVIAPSTVQQGVIEYAQQTRDPVVQVSQDVSDLITNAQNLVMNTAASVIVNSLYKTRSTNLYDQQTTLLATANQALDVIYNNLQTTLFNEDELTQELQAQLAQIELEVQDEFLQNENEQILQAVIQSRITSFGYYIQIENDLLPALQEFDYFITNATKTLNPYNYMFQNAPPGFNWTDPNLTAFVATMVAEKCLVKVFNFGPPAFTITPCSITFYDPDTYFNCINGPWNGARALLEYLLILAAGVLIWYLAGKQSFKKAFSNQKPSELQRMIEHGEQL